jgi:general secretion pathway protein B
MSFILDALKKSEMERQRQLVPGLMDPGAVPTKSRLPRWAVALGVLLAINLGVLSFVLLRSPPAAAPKVASIPAASAPAVPLPVSPTAAPSAAPDHFSPMDGAPTYAPEIPPVDDAKAPTLEPKTQSRRADAPERSRVTETARAADPDDDEVLPSIAELNLSGPEALPDLHLDVHVYATNPADRFVYVNGRKYHEGAHMQEGPVVEHIRRDGVVLSYQGIRFLLPRE